MKNTYHPNFPAFPDFTTERSNTRRLDYSFNAKCWEKSFVKTIMRIVKRRVRIKLRMRKIVMRTAIVTRMLGIMRIDNYSQQQVYFSVISNFLYKFCFISWESL